MAWQVAKIGGKLNSGRDRLFRDRKESKMRPNQIISKLSHCIYYYVAFSIMKTEVLVTFTQ